MIKMLTWYPRSFTAAAYIALYVAFGVVLGISTGFLVSTNDFWGNWYIAMHLFDHVPESLYSGAFPAGYPFLLRAAASLTDVVAFSYLLNCACAALVLASTFWLCRRMMPGWWSVVPVILVSLYPRMFHYVFTAGADMGAVGFFTLGTAIILGQLVASRETGGRTGVYVIGGVLFGLAALWRYHALVAGVLFLVAVFAFRPGHWLRILISGVAMLAVYAPQFAINAATGHGLLETCHGINVYNLMYGVNWHRVSELPSGMSIPALIASHPLRFVVSYGGGAARLGLASIPGLVMLLRARGEPARMASGICFMFCATYALMFGMSASPRAVLLVVPISFVFAGMLAAEVTGIIRRRVPRSGNAPHIIPAVLLIAAAAMFAGRDVPKVKRIFENRNVYRRVGELVALHGVRSGMQVFATDFDIYFPAFDSPRPLYNGGWGRIAAYGYSRVYPELAVDDINDFISDCYALGIRMLVLTDESRRLSPVLHAIYSGTLNDLRLRKIGRAGRFKVFAVREIA
ncbi:MAG: hypothetical protein GF418_01115 [Chitinivibrionales bacterium]|nr:hypothetical protein [Chitinivibrionales bacterium]MBD3394202.1 hypothetical protein [Chitinivibrionales bacterium]